MWVLWLYFGGVIAVIGGVLVYYKLTPERERPAHSQRALTAPERAGRSLRRRVQRKPPGKRQQARRDARRAEWAARVKRARALLRAPQAPQEAPAKPPAPKPALVKGKPEDEDWSEPPAEWAEQMRHEIAEEDAADPDAHLRRVWSEGKETGAWSKEMLARMLRDGQAPPEPAPPLDRTETWLAQTELAGEDADAFMGRQPKQGDEQS